ncbi:Adaptive-response sensory-kinase SasA [Actinomadura sp. RB99]|uniref:PAS domain-containing sensor histidine kinase n=1 Tax=Actinomadura sp. RB99 TaxID=2691577 RepID=UPI001682B55D|nr:PAS domain-containing sensor histidine kinase [Actinomadura sp. RB99]MBD2899556.1 Adaptive-response sensory-kinase SasA [Actinomadura sp. RB99]
MAEIDLSAVFDALPVGCAVFTPDLRYVMVNCAYERLAGRSREQLIGRPFYEVFPGGPAGQGVAQVRASLERVVAERETDIMPLQRYDVEAADRPGVYQERYWSIRNAPLLGPDGAVTALLHRVEEVTSYIMQLRAARSGEAPSPEAQVEGVEAELFARTRELQEVNDRLHRARQDEHRAAAAMRDALRRQQQAVADTSHDLRGPLTGLQTRLQLALADPESDSRAILHAALDDAERLGDIVSDLLELARLEAGVPIRTGTVDLTRLVEDELAGREPGVALTARLESGVEVEGSAVRLARLLRNLVSNAERHAASRVEVLLAREGGQAVLRVVDDGPGIPPEEREAIFRRFYRRPDARAGEPEGTGLGLAIARQVAVAHRGTLAVADRPSGTCMVLRLPLCGS